MPRLLKDLTTGVCQIEFELDESECAAIGRVTAHWAYLEHVVFSVTKGIAEVVGVNIPNDALNMSFSRRLGAMRVLVEQHAEPPERKRMERLIGMIANAEQDRHKMTHALWDWDPQNPERIHASSFRPRFEFEKSFDAASLHKLADRIGQVSFELKYPTGWDDAFRETLAENADPDGNVAFFSMSRDLARMLVSKSRERAEGGEIDPI